MTTMKQLLDQKGNRVWSAQPDDSVFDAIQRMASKDIGSLIVMENDRPVGLFTERHYAREVILKGKSSPRTRVGDVMEPRVLYASPEQTVEECMAIMTERHIRHLPVLDGDRLVGIVSIGDLVKSVISDQKFTIAQLERYIRG